MKLKDSFFTADLYQYNILVAQLHITITDEDYTIDVAKVIVPQLMPCPEQLLKLWFRCRGMANNTQHYIALINHIFNFKNPHIRHAYFVLSLLNGSYNYVDKYWISINEELSFDFYGQKITYKPISYQTINNLQNHINKEIDSVLLYDILFFEKDFSKYHDLCYMTNGTKQSRWVQDGERLLFEKREDAALIKKEIKVLNDLREIGFVVPLCNNRHYDSIQNKVRKPFDTIVKTCVVDDQSHIVACETINGELEHMPEILCNQLGIKNSNTEAWQSFVKNIEKHGDLNFSNFGFLIKNKTLCPAAWSNPYKENT